jgi:hypothetical protein
MRCCGPAYVDDEFILQDVGVVILDNAVTMPTYGKLPTLNYLDQFVGKAKSHTLFEAVGYGLESSSPQGNEGGNTRMKSQPVIVNQSGVYGWPGPPGRDVLWGLGAARSC